MGIYLRQDYVKNNGKWVLFNKHLTKTSSELGRWQRDIEVCQNSLNEKTKISSSNTRSGLNKKVDKITSYYGQDIKSEMHLITTANKLGKSDKAKYKGISWS